MEVLSVLVSDVVLKKVGSRRHKNIPYIWPEGREMAKDESKSALLIHIEWADLQLVSSGGHKPCEATAFRSQVAFVRCCTSSFQFLVNSSSSRKVEL